MHRNPAEVCASPKPGRKRRVLRQEGHPACKKNCQIPHMNHISEAARPGSNKLRTCRRMPRQNRDWALDRLGWGGCICGNRPTRAKHGLNGRKNVDDDDDDGAMDSPILIFICFCRNINKTK